MFQTKIIKITDIAELTVLSTRGFANTVTSLAEEVEATMIVLDFTGVEVATRSFFDQLNSNIKTSEKQYSLINLASSLIQMLKIVNPEYA